MRSHVATICAGLVLLWSQPVDAGMSLYSFSFESDGDFTNGPFGSLKVVEGFNATFGVDTLTFTIDIDESKLGGSADIHQFAFQLDYLVDLVPKPQIVGSGANTFELEGLSTLSKVAGYGKTTWDYVVDFGKGANPTLDPVSFTVGAPGLSLSELDRNDVTFRNNKTWTGELANFAVHVQSTGTNGNGPEADWQSAGPALSSPGTNVKGSEAFGGFYEPQQVVPENGNLLSALAALAVGMACLLVKLGRAKWRAA